MRRARTMVLVALAVPAAVWAAEGAAAPGFSLSFNWYNETHTTHTQTTSTTPMPTSHPREASCGTKPTA